MSIGIESGNPEIRRTLICGHGGRDKRRLLPDGRPEIGYPYGVYPSLPDACSVRHKGATTDVLNPNPANLVSGRKSRVFYVYRISKS